MGREGASIGKKHVIYTKTSARKASSEIPQETAVAFERVEAVDAESEMYITYGFRSDNS
ncbi:hypothetical protein J32TS6_04370 [Virgibacillus pantothenticus]|nr:hypothetical protein J32TS6_04370 [Virgibacillus pantothenticus]